jgi:hypothetical protein
MFLPGETRSITRAVLSLTQVKCSSLLTGPPLNYGSTEITVYLYLFISSSSSFSSSAFPCSVYSLVLEAILSECLPFLGFGILFVHIS